MSINCLRYCIQLKNHTFKWVDDEQRHAQASQKQSSKGWLLFLNFSTIKKQYLEGHACSIRKATKKWLKPVFIRPVYEEANIEHKIFCSLLQYYHIAENSKCLMQWTGKSGKLSWKVGIFEDYSQR